MTFRSDCDPRECSAGVGTDRQRWGYRRRYTQSVDDSVGNFERLPGILL